MRIALGLEYDGSCCCGWQTQPSGSAGQDLLERALSEVAGAPARSVSAGRTDAGVHATWQVVHFDTDARRPLTAWVRGVNAHLPRAMAVLWAKEVQGDFHARFSATERHYRYLLLNHAVRPAVMAGKVGWFHGPLDVRRMEEAARCLPGRHDFSAFRASACQARSPVRTLSQADVTRHGDLVVLDFRADAFLHHMVRNLVGCLVQVGAARQPVEWLAQVLDGRDRTRAAPTFAPDGLYLAGVRYDERWSLPEPRWMPLRGGPTDEGLN